MKLKNIFGVVVAAGVMAAASVTAFAADGYTLGTPFDITTNESTSTLEVDHVVAIPVDISTTTNGLTAYTAVVKYDSSVLAPTVTLAGLSSTEKTNIKALAAGSNANIKTHGSYVGAIQGYVYDSGWAEDVVAGTLMVNVEYPSDAEPSAACVSAGWMTDGTSYGVSDKPEFYLVFKVVGESSSDALNTPVAEVIESESMVADTDNGKASTSDIPSETEVKTNACAGAFKVVVDAESLPKFLHALYVSFDDGATKQDITEYVTADDKVFEFPVRVSSTKGGTVTAKIYADLGTTDAAVTDASVEIGSVTVDLTGTATDYTAATTTIE
jgi:hypothetical protein